jgi:broad specificity phosphatase PhoE
LPIAKGAKGWGGEIAPLTLTGIEQIKNIIPDVHEWGPELIVTSPTSRTLHTCALLASQLSLPFEVEFDLYEWAPNLNLMWETIEEVQAALDEMEYLGGEWPEGEIRVWEPISSVRQRASNVLQRYTNHTRVAVTCHQVVIKALTGETLELAEHIEFEL